MSISLLTQNGGKAIESNPKKSHILWFYKTSTFHVCRPIRVPEVRELVEKEKEHVAGKY
jgi:hypothetical protein